MPQGGLTGTQVATKDYVQFGNFTTMDTQSLRWGMDPKKLYWCENVQIDAPNKLIVLAGPAAPANTIPGGRTVVKMWGLNSSPLNPGFGNLAATICFCSDGSMFDVTPSSVTQVAPTGTFINPDVTVYNVPPVLELLIADPNGYYAWNTVNGLIGAGSVSPHIVVTAGGSGYVSPTATITGGSGSGATASVQSVGGVITGLTLTNGGTGYKAGDTLTVTITGAPGTGATATAIVWPFFSLFPSTASAASIAIFQGRVWLAAGKNLTWTGTKGLDDSNPANASGSTLLSDADVVLQITALRNLNNFLWIFCDQAIKQIGTISVSGSTTVFSIVTLSSDIGCEWPQSIQSYNRLVLFAHYTGVYAVLGSSVEKISEQMQGIFDSADFSQQLSAFIADVNNRHVYGVLIRYVDQRLSTTRSLILIFQRGAWYVLNQGNSLKAVGQIIVGNGIILIVGSSGADVTQLVAAAVGSATNILVQTALTDHGKPMLGKKLLRQATVYGASVSVSPVTLTVETENGSDSENFNLAGNPFWPFMVYVRGKANGTGIYCGFTWSGTMPAYQCAIHSATIEFQETTALASKVGV